MSTTLTPPIRSAPPADPFTGRVVVRQVDEDPEFKRWELQEPLCYRGQRDEWTVPAGFCTDFASVPRVVTWLIPRYGRYTKAAIVHDFLCGVEVPLGRMSRADADGVFRRALRELGVAFLRRWLMWAAVRLDAALESPTTLVRPRARLLLVWLLLALPGIAFAAAPAIVILVALGIFWVVEEIVFGALRLVARRDERGRPLKHVNPPRFPWTT
jgi:Protein of unknown function (DUF1353)